MNHSKNAIVKPQGKTPEMAQKEVDEAMKKVREATQAITTTIVEPGLWMDGWMDGWTDGWWMDGWMVEKLISS